MQAAVIDWKRGRLGGSRWIRSFDSGTILSGGQSELQTRVITFPTEKLEINFERARDHFFDMPAKTAIFNNI